MRLRHLNIHFVSESRETSWRWQISPLSDLLRSEAKLVYEAQRDSRKDLDFLWSWHSDTAL